MKSKQEGFVGPASGEPSMTWEDYCALSDGGLESPATLGKVYQNLTGKAPTVVPAVEVMVTVVREFRLVTKSLTAALTLD